MTADTFVERKLNTEDVDAGERRAAYLREIDNALATVFLVEPVHAQLTACYIGPMRVIELAASPRRSERTAALIARDRHDGISIQLAILGRSIGEAAGRAVVSDPGTVMILDFAQPFVMVDQEPRTVINVAIPRAVLAAHVVDIRALHGRVLDADTAAMLAAQLRAMTPRLADLPAHAGPVLRDIIVNLLLLALGHDPADKIVPIGDRRAGLLDRAKQLVDSRLGSADLTPEWLVVRLNVSRSELYAAFEELGGISRFIWRRRLDGARTALLDLADNRRIGEIAFAFGFSSEAHFARAFRGAFDQTASETRRSRAG